MPELTDEYYIAPEDLTAFKDGSNNLNVEVAGRGRWAKVAVRLAFPYSDADHFVSLVRDGEDLGMIRDLAELADGSRAVLREALKKRYHLPQVTRILAVREARNATVWTVETNKGQREFLVRDKHNFRRIKGGDLIIVDVDGNRFRVPRGRGFDPNSQKLLDMYS